LEFLLKHAEDTHAHFIWLVRLYTNQIHLNEFTPAAVEEIPQALPVEALVMKKMIGPA
jgi:hypothetical protein